MTFVRKDYITLLFYGISLTCCAYVDERGVQYKGAKEVWEGEPFKITCVLAFYDLEGWTINSTVISEDNALGYFLSERTIDPFRKEVILQAKSAQLHHEGAYRCNRYSRDYHYLKILPAWAEGNDQEKVSAPKPTNEYILTINKTIKFHCSSARNDNVPVTWYKNSRRILENVDSNVFTDGLSLIIENAQEDDAGEYMCAIDNPHVTGYTDIGRLFRLNSPPKIAEISHNENVIQRRHLKIRCKVKGYPPPKVIWYIGNLNATKLKETDPRIHLYSTDDGSTIFHLDIQNVSFSDRGLFTCKAENSLDSGSTMSYDEASVFVHVMENMIVTNEDKPGMGKLLIPGEPLTLECNTTDCSHCQVVWFKDGEPLYSSDYLEIFDNNTITIEKPSYNDSGVYVCAIDRMQLDVALNASITVQSNIKLDKFDASSVAVEGSPLEIYCSAKGAPILIKWFIGDQEIYDDDSRVKLLDHDGLKKGKLLIEEADFDDRNHYTCEAYNQVDAVNTTVFIRIKGKLAALWPFLGICAEVAILGTIIFVYERRKSMNHCDEPDTDLPAENKHRDQKGKGPDVRQRK